MGYTHFKGISLLEEGLAVGPKGQERKIINVSGKITILPAFATAGSSALDHYDGYIVVSISGEDKKIPYLD